MPDNKGYMNQKEAENRLRIIHRIRGRYMGKNNDLLSVLQRALLTIIHLRLNEES